MRTREPRPSLTSAPSAPNNFSTSVQATSERTGFSKMARSVLRCLLPSLMVSHYDTADAVVSLHSPYHLCPGHLAGVEQPVKLFYGEVGHFAGDFSDGLVGLVGLFGDLGSPVVADLGASMRPCSMSSGPRSVASRPTTSWSVKSSPLMIVLASVEPGVGSYARRLLQGPCYAWLRKLLP